MTPPAPAGGGARGAGGTRGAGGGGGGGGQDGRGGSLALPGVYTVKLTVDGKVYTQPLTVRRDPRLAAVAR